MKEYLRRFLRRIYFFAFPEHKTIVNTKELHCILGEESYIYPSSFITNPSLTPGNITIGNHTYIAGNLAVWSNAGKIEIGDFSFIGENSRVWSVLNIKIGNRVQIAHGCNIFDSNIHSLNPIERHREFIQNVTLGLTQLHSMSEKPIIINDDAWLGANVIVLKGVTIGCGAVVGAGSVVVSDVPDYAVVIGNPAKVVKYLH